jgi:hypothetical protein
MFRTRVIFRDIYQDKNVSYDVRYMVIQTQQSLVNCRLQVLSPSVCIHVYQSWYIHGVSKKFGEWYQKTNKTEDRILSSFG